MLSSNYDCATLGIPGTGVAVRILVLRSVPCSVPTED